jgi:hypothetical protein
MLRRLGRFAALAVIAVLALSLTAQVRADSLGIGGMIGSPGLGAGLPTGGLAGALATIPGAYTLIDSSSAIVGTGTYNAYVWSPDPDTGFTTIAFNFAHGTGDALETVSLSSFGTYTTDVVAVGPGVNATTVTRSSNGNVLTFHFDGGVSTSSDTFVIRTNSTIFSGGSIQFIDGGVSTDLSFSPVPLPATANMGLVLLGGIGGLGALRRLRNANRVEA